MTTSFHYHPPSSDLRFTLAILRSLFLFFFTISAIRAVIRGAKIEERWAGMICRSRQFTLLDNFVDSGQRVASHRQYFLPPTFSEDKWKKKKIMHRQNYSSRRCAIFVALILNRLVHKTKRLLLITNTNARRNICRESSAEIVAARVIAPQFVRMLKIMLFSNGTHHGSDDDYLPAFTYSSRSQPKHAFCYRQIRKSMAGALRQLTQSSLYLVKTNRQEIIFVRCSVLGVLYSPAILMDECCWQMEIDMFIELSRIT